MKANIGSIGGTAMAMMANDPATRDSRARATRDRKSIRIGTPITTTVYPARTARAPEPNQPESLTWDGTNRDGISVPKPDHTPGTSQQKTLRARLYGTCRPLTRNCFVISPRRFQPWSHSTPPTALRPTAATPEEQGWRFRLSSRIGQRCPLGMSRIEP